MSNDLALPVKPVTEISAEDEKRVAAWINTEDYKLKNFARQALVVNPATTQPCAITCIQVPVMEMASPVM